MRASFDHERLAVYQRALRFVAWADQILRSIPKSLAAHDQLDRASTSIPLNIAEGNGKFTPDDRCRFFDTARGSALESAACLDVLTAKNHVTQEQTAEGKAVLLEIVSMLVGLIKSNSQHRVFEEGEPYGNSANFRD